ncbi:Fc.00g037870.m01.CDS01 [Cosmosporella sp. VM-42]
MNRPSPDHASSWVDQHHDDEDDEFLPGVDDEEAEACLAESSKSPLKVSPASLPVYMTIHRVRRLVLASIDDPYTLEHFRDPRMNALIVRPLVDRLYNPDDISIVYCLLANRVSFLRDQSKTVHQSVNVARATLCELVASRVLRRFHEDNSGPRGLLVLAHILVEGFDPFQGAPSDVTRQGRHHQWPIQERNGHERKITALELAIISESKLFISSSACQRAVDAVHDGQIVYTPLSFMDILPDHYKHRPISLYDPRKAPLLNHHRLIVPRTRNVIELLHFIILLALYVLTMVHRHKDARYWEIIFAIYTAGWVLEKLAAIIEHGWDVHAQNLWSFLDITFTSVYGAYLIARLYDLLAGQIHNGYGLPILCIAAPVMLTRVAFNLMPNNIVFISLHAMMKDFTVLTFLALWCFTGFLLALQWLVGTEDGVREEELSWITVGKWMLWIWFGLDGTGIEESVRFHVVLGPALIIAFAFLGNTLFLTILVAMLTNTFSKIIADETAEIQFRRAVLTFEGVKSDSIFAYPPPFNILALITLLPLKLVVSARIFHIVNVALIRILNLPTLLLVSFLERRRHWAETKPTGKKSLINWQFTGFSPHGDIQAVFKAAPPPNISDMIDQLDPLGEVPILEDDLMPRMSGDMPRSKLRRARLLKRQEERKLHRVSSEVIWEEGVKEA